MIPGGLASELSEALTDWAIGEPVQFITAEEADELAEFLIRHVLAKHLYAIARRPDDMDERFVIT